MGAQEQEYSFHTIESLSLKTPGYFLGAANRESLELDYSDLSGWDPENSREGSPYSKIAMWIADAPTEMFVILQEVGSTSILPLHCLPPKHMGTFRCGGRSCMTAFLKR